MSVTQVTIVRGKTFGVRDLLKREQFQWSPEKSWWHKSPALDEADRFSLVKEIRRLGVADEVEVKNIRSEWA